MVFKVLCLTLVACALVQAAPQLGEGWDFFAKTIDAGFETVKENTDSTFSKLDAELNAVQVGLKAGLQVGETGMQNALSVPRAMKKMGEKWSDDSHKSKNFIELSNEAFSEVIDENVESEKKSVTAIIDAGASIFNAADKVGKNVWTVATSPIRFYEKMGIQEHVHIYAK